MPRPAPVSVDPVAAASGDRAAREQLVAAYGPGIYGLCVRLAREPDDAYQDIWIKAFSHLHRFDPQGPASLRTWLMTLARRQLIDRHRKVGRRGEVVGLDGLCTAPEAEQQVHARQRSLRLEQALTRLPVEQRRAIVGHHLEGLSLEELAADEATQVGTIKSRLHRGRARLAAWLGAS